MKDKFMEKDGELFLRCKPENLKPDSKMPCIIQLINDESPMGLCNRDIIRKSALNPIMCINVICPLDKANSHRGAVEHLEGISEMYYRFEIIAKHCPEGSPEWALFQIHKGRQVWHPSFEEYYRYEGAKVINNSGCREVYPSHEKGMIYYGDVMSDQRWLEIMRNLKYLADWQIYKEPNHIPQLKDNQWYLYQNKVYYQFLKYHKKKWFIVRKAGSKAETESFCVDVEKHFIPTSLIPDFTGASAGDKVFRMDDGYKKITVIESDDIPIYAGNSWFDVRGFPCSPHKHEHPTLFHSHHQAKAYFAELFRKLDDEEQR